MDLQDIDWDYEDYGRKENQEKELMKGIKKFESRTIYKSKTSPSDEEFVRFEFDQDLNHLIEYGAFVQGKLTQMTRYSQPLKNTFKNNQALQVESNIKAKVPDDGISILNQKNVDERKRVGDQILEFPETAIGYVLVEFNDNTVHRGTGSMVGPNHVLTAAHIVYDRTKPARKIVRIRYWPGLKGLEATFQEVDVARVIILDKYKNNAFKQTEENDVCLLILNRALGLTTGWFGLYNPEKAEAMIKNYQIQGYPEDCQKLVQHCVKSKAIKPLKETFEYENDATSGMNGGPIVVAKIMTETYTEFYLVGLHLRNKQNKQQVNGSVSGTKVGVRLTKEKFDEIEEIIEYFFLKESLDDSFYNQMIKHCSEYTIKFDNTKNIDQIQMHNAIHVLRFNLQLQSLTIRSKTADNKSILTDETLQIFHHSCSVLRQLKVLKLDLYECSNLTDNGIKELARGLQNLNDIQNISLFFSNCKHISSGSLKDVFTELGHMPQMQALSVTFMNMESIDDEAIKSVGVAIYKNQGLKTLKLHFQTIPNATEAAFHQVVGNIKCIEGLERLSLTIFGFKFSEEIKKEVKNYFKKLHQLTVL